MSDLRTMPVDKITFEDVRQFCARQIPENSRLDYKRDLQSVEKIAALVAAFANTQGGDIIFGVKEVQDKDGVPDPNPTGERLPDGARQTIRTACAREIFPPVSCEISNFIASSTDEQLGFIVVRVPMSDEVPHSVEGRRGIYVRVADSKEPLPADIDQIEFMLGQRERSIDFQIGRRVTIFLHLKELCGKHAERGGFFVTIGPHVSGSILWERRELIAASKRIASIPSGADRANPFESPEGSNSILDGVYALRHGGRVAGYLDVFGNIGASEGICRAFQDTWEPVSGKALAEPNRTPKTSIGADADLLAARLTVAWWMASRACSETGFTGPMIVRVQVLGVKDLALKRVSPSGDIHELGNLKAEDGIDLTAHIDSDDLIDEKCLALTDVLDRVIWAWGCDDEEAAVSLLNRAEVELLGRAECRCSGRFRGRSRTLCLFCRQAAKS